MKDFPTVAAVMFALTGAYAFVSRISLSMFWTELFTGRLPSLAFLKNARAGDRDSHAALSATLDDITTFIQELAALADYKGTVDINNIKEPLQHIIENFHRDERLPKEFILKLLDHSIRYHKALPNIVAVNRSQAPNSTEEALQYSSNVTIVGDLHGQFADFAQIFENDNIGGYPSASNQFIFNGDLVDRGDKGLEIVIALLFAKALCPSSVHMLRGNHETTRVNETNGFKREVLQKYDMDVLNKFRALFDTLPVAAVVEKTIFVVHGGLGPKCARMTLADINALYRIGEPSYDSPLSELLWSDPRDDIQGCRANAGRGTGYYFGPDVTETFLARNGLQLLIRSHQVCMQGLRVLHNNQCLTVFSAPNYCGNTGNLAAVLRFIRPDSMTATARQYGSAAHERARREQQQQKGTEGEGQTLV